MKANFQKLLSVLLVLVLLTSMVPAVTAEGDVVEVGSAADLAAAVQNNCEIKLTDSFALSEVITVPSGTTLTLDLNGKTITCENGREQYIANAGTLTVKDSATGGKIVSSDPSSSREDKNVYCITNTGTLTIESGQFVATGNQDTAYAVYNESGNLTITGGTFHAKQIHANTYKHSYVLGLGGTGTVNISNATMEAENSTASKDGRSAVLYLLKNGAPEITVNSGTFSAALPNHTNGASLFRINGTGNGNAKLTIQGGTFDIALGTKGLFDSIGNIVVTISGGSFPADVSKYLPEGYTQMDSGAVIKFENVDSFDAFCEALENGSNVKLTDSFTLTGLATVPAGKTVILDLNGKTITSSDCNVSTGAYLVNHGTLTILDSVGTGGFSGENTASANAYGIHNTGTLTVDGGNFTVNSTSRTAYTLYSEGPSVTINGGTFTANYNASGAYSSHALALAGSASAEESVVTITGGTFVAYSESNANARCAPIFARGTAKLHITVEDGTFTATRTASTYGASAVRYGDSSTTDTVTIKGGIFNATAGSSGMFTGSKGTLNISGGTFTYDGTIINRSGTVTGGTFVKQDGTKNDISSKLAEGYVQNLDGSVSEAPDEVVIGTTSYKTLEEALLNSKNGDTVTLQTDVKLTDDLILAEGITLDLNGKTLETTAVFGYGHILDSQQSGLLTVAQDKVTFAADNGHLPVYDAAAGGYRMAQVKIQTKPATSTGVFYMRFDLTNAQWETLLPENEIALLVRVSGHETTYAASQQWLTALYNDTTGRGAIKVTFIGWDNLVHNLTVYVANTGTAVEIPQEVDNNEALVPNADGVYEIWTANGLRNMVKNAGQGYSYKLMADIDMGGKDWTPVSGFKGTFDGNGKTISNFKITKAVGTTMGFFANTAKEDSNNNRTTIRNLHLKDVQIIVDGVDDDVNENSAVRFVGSIVGDNYGDVEGCSSVCTVVDKRQLADLKKTYYGTLVGNNAERTVQNADGTTQRTPLGVISGTNDLETTVNITKSSEDFRNPGIKVNSKMALFLSSSVDYATKTEKTAVGIAGNSNSAGIDKTLLWQDLTNSTDLAPQVLQDRRETAAAQMYEMCTVEWQPATTMYNYTNYDSDGSWSVETKVSAAENGFFVENLGIQRGLPYAHSSNSMDRFNAFVGHYTKGSQELWDPNAYFYNNSASISDGSHQLYDQTGWGMYIGSDCSGQVSGAWRMISATARNTDGFVRLIGTAEMYPSQENYKDYGILPVNGLLFDMPGDADGDGTANQSGDRAAYVSNYYQNNKTHYLDSLAMVSKADILMGYTKNGGHSIMAISDAVVVRKWNGTIDANLSYIVTAEQGGSGTDSDGINRYSKETIYDVVFTTIEWTSTCCVDRRTTFADLAKDGDGAGVAPWMFFPITCDALRNADSAAGNVTITMDATGIVNSNFHIVSTTVNGETVYTDISQSVSGYRSPKTKVDLTAAHGTIAVGTPVTVRLSNGKDYTGIFGTAGLTEAK